MMPFTYKSLRPLGLATLAVLGAVVFPQAAHAQSYAFTTFDYASATYTIANGISNGGQIVGSYGVTDGSGNQTTSGFTATTAAAASSNLTSYSTGDAFSELTAINSAGQTAGDYVKSDGTNPGFLLSGQTHTDFLPNGYFSIVPFGIATSGALSGTAIDNSGVSHVFVGGGGVFTFFSDAKADAFGTSGGGGNDAGVVVGSYTNSAGGTTAFSEVGGVFTDLTIPAAVSSAANDINNLGDVVGSYHAGDPLNPTQGFLLTAGGTLLTLNFPGALSTEIRGVNDSRQVVGDYTDASGNVHGFFASPAPEPSSAVALGMGMFGLAVLAGRARRQHSVGSCCRKAA